ncbi:MAG: exo-beta-N-acetylmuramidase NamZ family protein, partial [Mycobacteriaceae bacterium]
VLDRPNPVGGSARGPMLLPAFTSAVGEKEIVQQHGMTVGELARFFDGEFLQAEVGARLSELTVLEISGWRREQTFADTGLTWVLPSPNMPTPNTALLYPGTCMFEATNLSEGRGTTRPFEIIGAPYIDYKWAEALAGKKIPGVAFREAYFTPTFSKNVGLVCGGVQVHITDPATVEAITAATHMMVEAKRLYAEFDWRGDGGRWIDLLTGSTRFRDMLTAGAPAAEIVGAWRKELSDWNRRRHDYLLY